MGKMTCNERGAIAGRPGGVVVALSLLLALSCTGDIGPSLETVRDQQISRVRTDRTYLRDEHDRYLMIHGINVSGSVKTPFTGTGDDGDWPPELVDFDDVPFTYVGRNMPLDDADHWFSEIRRLGFNAVRLLIVWEGIEPDERGVYDEEYLDYIEELIAAADRNHLYVLIDMHQDMFSRHLYVRYNENPIETMNAAGFEVAEDDVAGGFFGALVPPYTNSLRGDGAPRWAVQACLPHKDMDSPHWGDPYVLGQFDLDTLNALYVLNTALAGDEGAMSRAFNYVMRNLPEPFAPNETTTFLPWTQWGIAQVLSPDLAYCVAAFMAGNDVMPSYEIRGQNVQDYLQSAYAAAFAQVARRVARGGYRNVIGYDLMNEPSGWFLPLGAAALVGETGGVEAIEPFVADLLGEELGGYLAELLIDLRLVPADGSDETLEQWGLDRVNLMAALGLNVGFDHNYLQPFYSRVAAAIQEEDPNAIIWIESSAGAELLLGPPAIEQPLSINMTWPEGVNQLVYAPHWYPDIYPSLGINMPPREFDEEEIRYRDYTGRLEEVMFRASYSLGNVPVVFGEFGTYYNFGGIENAREADYGVSSQFLDNYYEGFEELMVGHMQWCFSPDNDYEQGDWWNREDFSVLDPNGEPRSEGAFSRPYARALSGKPISSHFYSPFHYFDPDRGVPNPEREFQVELGSRETDAPTEVFVPRVQYPEGFYVWLSDGRAMYDDEEQILYYFPTEDHPDHVHQLRIRPPLEGSENDGWSYFFRGSEMVNGR